MKSLNDFKSGNQVDLIANESTEAKALIESISGNNYSVNHIYSGSSIPVLRYNDLIVIGSNNIRASYTRQYQGNGTEQSNTKLE